MIILNELEHAQNLLVNGFKNFINIRDLTILAKYFRQTGDYEDQEIELMLVDFCKRCDQGFNEVLQDKRIDAAVRKSRNFMLRIPVSVPITKNELNTIRSLKNYRYEKVLFTMLVLAKYYRFTNIGKKTENKNYFLTVKGKTVFRMAHISEKKNENILYELGQLGLLDKNLKYGSFFFPFANTEDNSDVVLRVDNINKILDYYIPVCAECGMEIEKKSNRQTMCKNCGKTNHKDIKRNWWNKNRGKLDI